MVHLAIAVHMHVPTGSIPTPAFLLGSIAPDAIHMRSNTGRADKQRVHLLATPDSAGHERVRALVARYWAEESGRADFAKGYAAHLLADRLWVQTVLTSFRASIPPLQVQEGTLVSVAAWYDNEMGYATHPAETAAQLVS